MIEQRNEVAMKQRHLLAYYCTLLLPVGALLGAGAGSAVGLPVVLTLLGAAFAVAASRALARSHDRNEIA
jgi:hypothetical protein